MSIFVLKSSKSENVEKCSQYFLQCMGARISVKDHRQGIIAYCLYLVNWGTSLVEFNSPKSILENKWGYLQNIF